jgi:hypothetical protein
MISLAFNDALISERSSLNYSFLSRHWISCFLVVKMRDCGIISQIEGDTNVFLIPNLFQEIATNFE